jgi:hypothetical protein
LFDLYEHITTRGAPFYYAWLLIGILNTPIVQQSVAQKCLACHGSYDKLAEKTANFKTTSGETVTPHQYVPHADKTDIPECTECHVPHPVALEDNSKVVKPDKLTYCYSNCHHMSNLQPCKNSH